MIEQKEIQLLEEYIKNYSYYYNNIINDIYQYIYGKSIKEEIIKLLIFYLLWSIERGNLCVDFEQKDLWKEFYDFYFENKDKIDLSEIKKFLENQLKNSEISEKFNHIFIFYEDRYLFFRKHYNAQIQLKECLQNIKSLKQNNINHYRNKILEYFNKIKDKKLDTYQIIAIVNSIFQNFFIISGGPGTGKTTIASHIIGIHIEMGYEPYQIAIAAPTGRAASRLYESIKNNIISIVDKSKLELIKPKTIHRLLSFKPYKNEFFYNEHNKLSYRLIIVDEASMIDIFLMKQLFSSISFEKSKFILLGDHNQLPSVKEGNTLSDLIPKKENLNFNDDKYKELIENILQTSLNIKDYVKNPYFIELKKSHRSNQNIKKFADFIINFIEIEEQNFKNIVSKFLFIHDNLETWDFNKESNHSVVWFCIQNKNSGKDLEEKILEKISEYVNIKIKKKIEHLLQNISSKTKEDWEEWSRQKGNSIKELYSILTNYKILLSTKKGKLGTEYINNYILSKIYKVNIINDLPAGIPILITENDYYNELYNGDLGVIIEDKYKNKYACFSGQDQNEYKFYSLFALHHFEVSFASTIHKSQGSEYQEILLVLESFAKNLRLKEFMNRQLLYTAITRAKKKVYLISSEENLFTIIKNKPKRITGISLWE